MTVDASVPYVDSGSSSPLPVPTSRQRLQAGAVLLESAGAPIDAVADRVGLTVAGFRRHFRETMGVSPSACRRRYQR